MVLDKMKDILVEQLECDPEDITMESLLVDDLGADSLDAIDIVMSVEDTFKVERDHREDRDCGRHCQLH